MIAKLLDALMSVLLVLFIFYINHKVNVVSDQLKEVTKQTTMAVNQTTEVVKHLKK